VPITSLNTTNVNNYGTGYAQINATVYAMGSFSLSPNLAYMLFVQTSGASLSVVASNTFNFQGTICYFVG
jgi:hypothetical protein